MKKLSLVLTLVLFGLTTIMAQRTITGTVADASGEALIGASVLVKGTSTGTTTDFDGSYSLNIPEEGRVLVFSYTGFDSQEIELGASNIIDCTMSEGVTLDAAVVTALGITKEERSLGYAVQEVGGDELTGSTETNLVQSLAGKVAGVQVTSSSGAAGGSSFFLIRGTNSINGSNQPLIVVDGVPIDNSQQRSGDATASVALSNRAIDINQDEIETVSVLKGAAATALYGSQAGNGAILITTKKGAAKGQSLSVDFSQGVTFSQISQVPELQTTYAQGRYLGYEGPETGSGYSYGPEISSLRYANDSDVYPWDRNGSLVPQDSPKATGNVANTYDRYEFFRTGVSSRTNLGIAASNDMANIRLSVGYTADQGVIPNNTFDKVNVGLNADTKLGDKVTVGIGAQYINSSGTRIEQGSNTSGVMLGLLRTTPTFDNSNGLDDAATNPEAYQFEDASQRNYRGGGGYDNPYWTSNNNPLEDEVNRLIGNITLSYKPTDWLTFSYRPGIDYYTDFRKQYFAIGSRTFPAGKVLEDQFLVSRFNADFLVTAEKQFTDDFNASVILGHNLRSFSQKNLFNESRNLVIPGFYDLSNGSENIIASDLVRNRNQAGFVSLDFNWRRAIYVGLTGRRESSTILPDGNNVYNYGSASLGLVFTEFMENTDVLTFGKIRGSYGTVGLDGQGFEYSTRTYYQGAEVGDGWTGSNIIQFPFNGVAGFSFGDVLGNPDLRPEKQSTLEFGVDLRFFKNRIGLDATYYSITSDDIILQVPVAPTSGSTFQVANAGSLSNKGFEVVLNLIPVQTPDFEWSIATNFTRNENEVVSLAEGVENVALGGFTGATTRAVVGVPYGTIFGFGFYRDAEGNRVIGSDGLPILDPSEKPFDSALPDFTVGITNSITYKGLTLSALLDIKQGGVMWNGTKSALYFWGTHQETADLRYTSQIFEGNNAVYNADGSLSLYDHDDNPDTAEIPRTDGANEAAIYVDEDWLAFGNANGFFGDNTEDFIEETSWVRLRNVAISYQLPKAVLGNRIQNLSIGVSARNLWLNTPYTGIDPETNLYGSSNAQGLDYFNMPGTKSYSINLKANF